LQKLAGITAILVGLAFVYMEIQQNGIVARASLASGTSNQIDSIYQQLSDPQFAGVYSKSLQSPESLTESERMQLNGFYSRFMPMFGRERILYRLGLWESPDAITKTFAPTFFADGYGSVWWSIRKETVASDMVLAIDSAIEAPIERAQIGLAEFDEQILQKLAE
jgi:hypothetical protein